MTWQESIDGSRAWVEDPDADDPGPLSLQPPRAIEHFVNVDITLDNVAIDPAGRVSGETIVIDYSYLQPSATPWSYRALGAFHPLSIGYGCRCALPPPIAGLVIHASTPERAAQERADKERPMRYELVEALKRAAREKPIRARGASR